MLPCTRCTSRLAAQEFRKLMLVNDAAVEKVSKLENQVSGLHGGGRLQRNGNVH